MTLNVFNLKILCEHYNNFAEISKKFSRSRSANNFMELPK